jgi:hypothetical protein
MMAAGGSSPDTPSSAAASAAGGFGSPGRVLLNELVRPSVSSELGQLPSGRMAVLASMREPQQSLSLEQLQHRQEGEDEQQQHQRQHPAPLHLHVNEQQQQQQCHDNRSCAAQSKGNDDKLRHESPPMTPSCSPPEEGQSLRDEPSEPTAATAGHGGAADQAKPGATCTASSDGASSDGGHRRRQRTNSDCWQLVDEGDRIACVMVTGATSPQAAVPSGMDGKEAFGLEVEQAWHAQLESLIEMGYGVKVAAEALRSCDGNLLQSFKYLERRR